MREKGRRESVVLCFIDFLNFAIIGRGCPASFLL